MPNIQLGKCVHSPPSAIVSSAHQWKEHEQDQTTTQHAMRLLCIPTQCFINLIF